MYLQRVLRTHPAPRVTLLGPRSLLDQEDVTGGLQQCQVFADFCNGAFEGCLFGFIQVDFDY